MKIKTYIGIFFILSTFLLNYLDQLFPNFTEFVIFGKSFKIIEGFNSHDIMWTIAQKLNLVFFAIGILLIFPFEKVKETFLKKLLIIVFLTSIVFNSYLAIAAIHDYVNGFGDGRFIITFLILTIFIASLLLLLLKLNRVVNNRKKEILRLKYEVERRIDALKEKDLKMLQIQSKVDSIQDTNIFITKKIEALECLPLFIKETDNMETWSKLAHRRAMMIYGQLDKQLKDLEEAKTIAL